MRHSSGAACLAGGGAMGALMRSFDWSATPVGPVENWPQSLRTALSILLGSGYPMYIAWGPEFVQFYNDAYRPILGSTKHPGALGQSTPECFAEIWDFIGPMFGRVMEHGEATTLVDQLLPLERHAYVEECYFTFSYSPIREESGKTGGVFVTVIETTERVIGERRLRTLRDLAARAAEAKQAEEACRIASGILAANAHDLPFSLIYLLNADESRAELAGAAGVETGSRLAPSSLPLDDAACWPLTEVLASGKPLAMGGIPSRFGQITCGPWPETIRQSVVLPIGKPGHGSPTAFLIAGVSPRRALDESYIAFLEMVAANIATAIANARAHEEEKRRAESLAELDRAKTAFFSNVSHEFRTPLTLLMGPLEDALSSAPEVVREQLLVAHRNSLRLLKLVNTLLDFSRIEAGRLEAVYEAVDLSALTAELTSGFRSAVERAGLELVVDCPALPEPVYADRDMWEKIVLNLLSNAFKFTFEGSITVALRPAANQVELSVEDTGTGIPAEELPRIFDRFHRVRGARGRTHEGTGIGLSLVQELVRLHGGSVRAESARGKGSRFVVSIPLGNAHLPPERVGAGRRSLSTSLGPAAYVEEALRWLPAESQERAAGAGPRARVLLADDNADLRDYLSRLLKEEYEVEAVPDGLRALERALAGPPDLVLTDVMMPGLDGFELLQKLRANPRTRTVPVILLSARAGEESRVEGWKAGADDYLVKPFTAKELLARVRTHLEMGRLRRTMDESLRESQERLRATYEQAPIAICELTTDGVFADMNREFCELTGYAREDLRNRAFLELIHPGDLAGTVESLPPRMEARLLLADGRTVWADLTCNAVRDAAGVPKYFIVAARDVTRRKEVLEGERRHSRRLAALARVAVEIAGANSSEAVRAIITRRAGEIIGAVRGAISAQPHAAGEGRLSAPMKDRGGTILGFLELSGKSEGDFTEDDEAILVQLAEMGSVAINNALLFESLRDREERLRALYNQVAAGIAQTDLAGRFVQVNETFCRIAGRSSGELLGLGIHDIIHAADLEQHRAHFERMVREGHDSLYETRYVRPDGSHAWVNNSLARVNRPDGDPLFAVAVVQDISDRKRLEEKLQHAAKLESLGVLAGGIAHDFNNLLTGILGNASLLMDELPLRSTGRSFASDIVLASERAAELTRQMLAYAGKGKFSIEPVDLSRQLSSIRSLIDASIPKHVRLELNLAQDLPPIEGDPGQIQQLVMNLVINGAEAAGEEPGTVRVTTELRRIGNAHWNGTLIGEELAPGEYVGLEVADDGCGMDSATQAKIFDPFFTTKFTGRGLGLAAVSGIIRSHGGALKLTSAPGQGSVFEVLFPVTKHRRERQPGRGIVRGSGTIPVAGDDREVGTAGAVPAESG
jgi:PAS domain S-box-containing protein